MKKLLVSLLTLTLIFTFAACGGDKTEGTAAEGEGNEMAG